MNKRTLFLITASYPYGNEETFITEELKHLNKYFNVIIISRSNKMDTPRSVPSGVQVVNIPATSPLSYKLCISPFVFLLNFFIVVQLLIHELLELRRLNIPLNGPRLKKMLHDLSKGIELKYRLNKIVKQYCHKQSVPILYSYWMINPALAIALMNKHYIKIARIHRFDLFFEKDNLKYLSFQRFKVSRLNKLYFVSLHGKSYWEKKFGNRYNNLEVCKLSTPIGKYLPAPSREGKIIVSCSHLIQIKRIHLIIEALSLIDKIILNWVHFGSGELYNELTNNAELLLRDKSNIQFKFMGQTRNADVRAYYAKNNPDLFIHTSSSEGLPVSIIEAMSYGIPVIGLDTDGVREVVTLRNGELLPGDATPAEIARSIEKILLLPEKEVEKLRKESYKLWQQNHHPVINNKHFMQSIQSLVNEST
jgi:glycosyltransferase involved in cell wall biosynthesis